MGELTAGSLLGPYRVERLLGAGGMGRVYEARDTRLDRAVAIKTSDERFTKRFEREAQAISALNHPNVCTLFDVGPDYLVMEFIEGESLNDRLARGPLPVDEALGIAAQIASALEVAHAKGITHRDLKPANVRITPDGTVKVLDFGIAQLARSPEPSALPTALTLVGGVIGTPGYMAPEQLRGEAVDKRADVWAFGALLYEMLTREPAAGRGVLDGDLENDARLEKVPGHVRRALAPCLAEDPRERLRDIGDFRLLLELAPAGEAPSPMPSRRAFAIAAAGMAGATALGAWGWFRTPVSEVPARARFAARLPEGTRMTRAAVCGPSMTLLPDGRTLIIAVTDSTGRRLYRRRIDEIVPTPIAGTSGAMSPFCSPDGAWIGFYADARLRRVPVEGGAPLDIGPAPGAPTGASWGDDDRIVFTHGWRSPLYVVPARGGTPEMIAPLRAEQDETYMRLPHFLPGGRQVLVEVRRNIPQPGVAIDAIDLDSGHRVALVGGSTPRYANGMLLVANGPSLLAAPLDLGEMTLAAAPTLLAEGLAWEAGGALHYAVSPNGTLAYAPGAERFALAVSDLSGSEERVLAEAVRFSRPRFSPDGRRIAVAAAIAGGRDDVWLYDAGGPSAGARLTFDGGTSPIWSQDGAAVAFSGDPFWTVRQPSGLYTKNADGRLAERMLTEFGDFHRPVSWIDEEVLIELTTDDGEFWIERFDGAVRQRLTRGVNARVSRDGRLLAYISDESGRDTVYVASLGEDLARWQIAEGNDPIWTPDGSELYYVSGTRLIAAQLDFSSGIRVASQRIVQESFAVPVYSDYDLAPNGQSIALVRPLDLTQGREVVVALDWIA